MALFRSLGARKDAVRGTTALEVRKGLAHLFTGAGVLPGADALLVAGTAGWAYSVGKAGFVSTRGASDGVHLFGNDGTVTIGTTGVGSTVPAAPGAGLARIDIMWVQQQSASEGPDTVSDAIFGVASGTPTSVPVAPSIPTGALELARNTMAGGSGTISTASAGNAITQTAAGARIAGGGIRRLGQTVLSADSTSSGGTEIVFSTLTATSPSGMIRLTVNLRLEATTLDAVFLVRVRQGSVAGAQLAAFYASIQNLSRTTVSGSDSATITAGVATVLCGTLERVGGGGSGMVTATSKIIVDEDPS